MIEWIDELAPFTEDDYDALAALESLEDRRPSIPWEVAKRELP